MTDSELRIRELAEKKEWSVEDLAAVYAALPALLSQLDEERKERAIATSAAFYAFVDGAKWWEWKQTGATMWQSDQDLAAAEAVKKYPYTPHMLIMAAEERAHAAEAEQASQEALDDVEAEAKGRIAALSALAAERGRVTKMESALRKLMRYEGVVAGHFVDHGCDTTAQAIRADYEAAARALAATEERTTP